MTVLFKDICSAESWTWKDNLQCYCSFCVHSVPGMVCPSDSLSFPKGHFLPLKKVFNPLFHLAFPIAEGTAAWTIWHFCNFHILCGTHFSLQIPIYFSALRLQERGRKSLYHYGKPRRLKGNET